MASLIEAIEIKRKMFFEHEGAPYYCIEIDVSKPTARGGQTLVRIKMRNLLTGAVFDKTFKAGEKFKEPDLVSAPASYLYADGDGFHFMDQNSFETLTLGTSVVGDDKDLLVDNLNVLIQKFNGNTATGGATKVAVLETGIEIRVPLFIKEGERVRVHTETRDFAGRA